MRSDGKRSSQSRTKLDPMNPAPPVTSSRRELMRVSNLIRSPDRLLDSRDHGIIPSTVKRPLFGRENDCAKLPQTNLHSDCVSAGPPERPERLGLVRLRGWQIDNTVVDHLSWHVGHHRLCAFLANKLRGTVAGNTQDWRTPFYPVRIGRDHLGKTTSEQYLSHF